MAIRVDASARIACRAFAVALCYLLAVQMFLAALAMAQALARADLSGVAPGAVCHGTETRAADAAPERDNGSPPRIPCVHCVLAAAQGALAPDALVVVAQQEIAKETRQRVAPALWTSQPARAGLSRAPPPAS